MPVHGITYIYDVNNTTNNYERSIVYYKIDIYSCTLPFFIEYNETTTTSKLYRGMCVTTINLLNCNVIHQLVLCVPFCFTSLLVRIRLNLLKVH